MSLKIKIVLDESSLEELEKKLNISVYRVIRQSLKDVEHNTPNASKLENLIDVLVEKGIINRSDVT